MRQMKYIAAALIFPLLVAGLMAGSSPARAQDNAESSNLAYFAALMQYIRSQPTPADVDVERLPVLAQLDDLFVDIYAEGFIAPFTGETSAGAKARIESVPTEDRYTAAMVESYRLASDTFLLDVMHILLASYYVNYFTTTDRGERVPGKVRDTAPYRRIRPFGLRHHHAVGNSDACS